MLTTLLVTGGVLAGLMLLLALIVALSSRPAPRTAPRPGERAAGWVADAGRPHPDAWSPLTSTTTTEIRPVR
ncbi:hypothetical protein [Geodermatophilus normandii]|uniref:Uncharacterized protein n=1 Tax=Geodermatophilus normandii TaxID=1137989 RepID=A0A6P0GML2_9ACTN|nr:hypothetical protein [Geodermatophilus normandii]NEM08608.1 hypothetical protein [Geodermatophilus normandii]